MNRLNEMMDQALAEYAREVRAGRMTLDGALARAFIQGMNYQAETSAETAAIARETEAERARWGHE